MSGDDREYDYKPKWTLIVCCAIFFGLGAVVLGSKAANNDRGLIINHVIELGPDNAMIFYWTLTACGIGFVAIAALLAYHRLAYQQRLAFGPAALIVPVSRWSRAEKEIAYRDIRELSRVTVNGQRFLYVMHLGGKHTIAASMLPSREAFEEICELLAARVRESQPVESRHI
jgi:hypothetical protein